MNEPFASNIANARKRGPCLSVAWATTAGELDAAFRIAYEVYRAQAFIPANPKRRRITPRQLHTSSAVFVAWEDECPVGTLTVYEAINGALPSESIFHEALMPLATEDRRAVEFGALMVLPVQRDRTPKICIELFRAAWLYSTAILRADALVACVQARHANFYGKLLRFRRLGAPKDYVCGALRIRNVVPMMLDLSGAESIYQKTFERYGDSPRNLYRYFVADRRETRLNGLQQSRALHVCLDWNVMRRRFGILSDPLFANNVNVLAAAAAG